MAADTFSYWEKTAFIDNANVVVIGSGIVGLSAAIHLKKQQPSIKVTVLERGYLPSGASTKNAGFCCFGTVSEQLSHLKHAPEEEIVALVERKWRGLKRLRHNLGDAVIDYHQHGGYELFFDGDFQSAEECRDNLSYLNNLLKEVVEREGVYHLANDKIAAFGFTGVGQLIYNRFEGQINTGKMMRALLLKAQQSGILVLNNTIVDSIDFHGAHYNVVTQQGNFAAQKVIVATNAFAQQLFPELAVTPGRGQVLITKPIPGLKLKGTYHFDEGYYYFRNIDGRVLFGGGRNLDKSAEATYSFGHTNLVQQQLIKYLDQVILPGQHYEVDQWWSGIMGFGEEITPIIKELRPNVFCAVRCNGMGVAMGSLVGEEVADLALKS